MIINKYLKLIQENYRSSDITLGKFSEEYYDELPADKKEIFYTPKRANYHILLLNRKDRLGIAGVILNPKYKQYGFFQIYIEREHRGKGILKVAAELIFRKYKLESLIATIKKYNKASIMAHEKAGFTEVGKLRQAALIERGYQKKDEVRYIYHGDKT